MHQTAFAGVTPRLANDGVCMRSQSFKTEAEECRRQATTLFADKPESLFLLRLASMFDELAGGPVPPPASNLQH
jgi:hypothetical protein